MLKFKNKLFVSYKKFRQATEEVEKLKRELTLIKLKNDNGKRYQELLLAVESKYKGESRHQTALRYIREREQTPRSPTTKSN